VICLYFVIRIISAVHFMPSPLSVIYVYCPEAAYSTLRSQHRPTHNYKN